MEQLELACEDRILPSHAWRGFFGAPLWDLSHDIPMQTFSSMCALTGWMTEGYERMCVGSFTLAGGSLVHGVMDITLSWNNRKDKIDR